MYAPNDGPFTGGGRRERPWVISRFVRGENANVGDFSSFDAWEGDFGAGLGRRLIPFGGSETWAATRLLNVESTLAVGEESPEADGDWRRREETGMRDLECGLPSNDVGEDGCKGAAAAMWKLGACTAAPSGQIPEISLLVRR